MKDNIKFIDLALRPSILDFKLMSSIKKTIKTNDFILGKDVYKLEKKLKVISKAKYVVTCSSGTDALILALLSLNIKKDDIVFLPSYTFISTAECVAILGGIPFFIDVLKNSFNINYIELEAAILKMKKKKVNINCIIAVDLFGLPCNFNEIKKIAKKHNLPIILDSAQSFGSLNDKKSIGSFGTITVTSFFPTKPLGCFGDGGAIFTNDKKLYKKLVSLRNHGTEKNKYKSINIGINSRLDTIQASVLLEKLKTFKKEVVMRQNIAKIYNINFKNHFQIQKTDGKMKSIWSQYSIVVGKKTRNKLKMVLENKKIFTNIYYPIPLHQQPAYKKYLKISQKLSVSEYLSKNILNLPIYPYMKKEHVYRIIFFTLKYYYFLNSFKTSKI